MINPEASNLRVCVWTCAATILLLSGCGGPLDRKMGLSDLDSPNPAVRVMAIKWAGDNKVSSAVPRLVELLQDEDPSVRFFAIEALERITGTNNGYDYKDSPQQRAEAVERWREFLKSNGEQNYENECKKQ
jgi:DNA polymerase IIIc chi subunit